MTAENRKNDSTLKFFLRNYREIFTAMLKLSPSGMVLRLVGKVLEGFTPAILGWLFMNLTDNAVAFLGGDTQAADGMIRSLVVLLGFMIVKQIFKMILEVTQEEVVNMEFTVSSSRFFEKIERMCALAFQNNEFKAELDTSRQNASRYMLLFYTEDILQYVSFFVSSVILLASVSVWLAAAMIIVFSGYTMIQYRIYRKNYSLDQKIERLEKQTSHLKSLFRSKYSVKELKIFDSADFIVKRMTGLYRKIMKLELDSRFRRLIISKLYNVLLEIIKAATLGVIIYKIYIGTDTVGSIALYTTISSAFGSLVLFSIKLSMLTESLVKYRKHDEFFDNPRWLEPMTDDMASLGEIEEIRFENVSFRYAENSPDVLYNLNFTLNKGEYAALVGINGSGKTTLVKLIAGVYQPTAGMIYYNGIPHTKIRMSDIRERTAMVYQDFCRYGIALRENVCFDREISDEEFRSLAGLLGINEILASLPNGADTRLRTDVNFTDATDLSGGQWQKLAIMRAAVKKASVFIMDEPSSALDIEAEELLYHAANQIVQSGIKLIISHQLACIRDVNRILVLDGGELMDSGTHKELMERNEVYRTMFRTQAEKYWV